MRNTHLLSFLTAFMTVISCTSQIGWSGLAKSKKGNFFQAGNFQGVINCSSQYLTSAGNSDLYIAKYDSKGECLWSTSLGDTADETISDITTDLKECAYVTGSYNYLSKLGYHRIRNTSKKLYESCNFYLLKLNPSGDPLWIKYSQNSARDEGCGIATDEAGNVYVAGTFENKFSCDGKSVTSAGGNDIFVMKFTSHGDLQWLRSFGDSENNGCGPLRYSGNKLYLSVTEQGGFGYRAVLLCIAAGNGTAVWSKTFGSRKGVIEEIAFENTDAILVSGYVEKPSDLENTNAFAAKLDLGGKLQWQREFTGQSPSAKAIACSEKGTVYVTGVFSDSLSAGKNHVSGHRKDDIFIAELSPNGVPLKLISAGNTDTDAGKKLLLHEGSIYLGGYFTNGLTLSDKNVNGPLNTVFLAKLNPQNLSCDELTALAGETKSIDDIRQKNIYGKLLVSTNSGLSFLGEQGLYLENNNNEILRRTMTDENGYFSFKNVPVSEPFNLVLENNHLVRDTDLVYLASQNGIILEKIEMRQKKFLYPVISAVLTQLQPMEEENLDMKLLELKENQKEVLFTERIHFDANSWTIPTEAIHTLDRLANYLRKNSIMRLEVSSFTDTRGDEDYNKNISKARAQEVKDYITKKGVPASRISTKGYGETKILNRCADNVICSELEHSFNRRVEFRVFRGISGF